MTCVNVFYVAKRKFSWIRQKTNNFPIDPDCKNRSLWQRHVYMTLSKESNLNNGGLSGNIYNER